MPPHCHQPSIGLLLSGGLDSAILLGQFLGESRPVVPFYVRTGCVWQDCELQAVRSFLAAVTTPDLTHLVVVDMPVGDLYDGHWSVTGRAFPDQFTSEEAVFLPGRNPLILLKPALWCRIHGIPSLAIATLSANPFGDATPSFFASFEAMIEQATGGSITIQRPFEKLAKSLVMQLGRHLPLELTFSCLAPVGGCHCGVCNKCAERRAAFGHLATGDPTRYADHPAARRPC